MYRRAGTGPKRPPSHLGLHRKLYKQVYNVEQDKPLDGMASGKAGLVLYSGQGACLHRPSELPQLVQKAPPCLLTSVTTENGPLSAQPLYPIPRQASSSELGGNNPSTHQDPTSKISSRPSHPVGSTVSVCGSFISLHPLPLAKNIGQSSQIVPRPRSANWRAVPVSFQMKKVAILCCGVRLDLGSGHWCPRGCMERESVKTDGLKKAVRREGNGLCSTYFHLFRLAFTGGGKGFI